MLADPVGTARNPLYQISNDAGTDIAMPVRRPTHSRRGAYGLAAVVTPEGAVKYAVDAAASRSVVASVCNVRYDFDEEMPA